MRTVTKRNKYKVCRISKNRYLIHSNTRGYYKHQIGDKVVFTGLTILAHSFPTMQEAVAFGEALI